MTTNPSEILCTHLTVHMHSLNEITDALNCNVNNCETIHLSTGNVKSYLIFVAVAKMCVPRILFRRCLFKNHHFSSLM